MSQQYVRTAAVDYSGFGEFGPVFQNLFAKIRETATARWSRTYEPVAGVPFYVAFQHLDRTNWWLAELFTALSRDGSFVDQDGVDAFWEGFRQSFRPALREHHAWDPRYPGSEELALAVLARSTLFDTLNDHRVQAALGIMNKVSFGPFREDEMQYLLKRHSWVVEIGGGSGYFAHYYSARGGEIDSYDNNLYAWAEDQSPWYNAVVESKILAEGGPEVVDHYGNRTLLMSWLQPRSSYPLTALERYHAAGGKYFAVKFGGFTGRLVSISEGSANNHTNDDAAAHVRAFFDELALNWIEVDHEDRPDFIPEAGGNNLWVFERK